MFINVDNGLVLPEQVQAPTMLIKLYTIQGGTSIQILSSIPFTILILELFNPKVSGTLSKN